MLKRIASLFMAIVLAFGLSVPVPALALVPGGAEGVAAADNAEATAPDTDLATKVETVDASDFILQAGGFNQPRQTPAAAVRGSLGAMGLLQAAQQAVQSTANRNAVIEQMVARADAWAGEAKAAPIQVRAYNFTRKEMESVFAEFVNEHGQFFYVSEAYETEVVSSSLEDEHVITFTMHFKNETYSTESRTRFESAVDAIVLQVDDSWSSEEKALFLHDYIVTHCRYDLSRTKGTTYDALIDQKAICQGYAELYDYLLDKVGIASTVVSSKDLNHAWNLVEISGETYYVDCTWDDPTGVDSATHKEVSTYISPAYCSHENFLVYKERFHGNHAKEDWIGTSGENVYESTTLGVSRTYEKAYWQDVITPIPHIDRTWAYVKQDVKTSEETATIFVHNYDQDPAPAVDGSSDEALVENFPARWQTMSGTGYWSGHFTSLATDGQSFFASTPDEIREIAADGSSVITFYTLPKEEKAKGKIYGIAFFPDPEDTTGTEYLFDYYLLTSPDDHYRFDDDVEATVTDDGKDDGWLYSIADAKTKLSASSFVYTGKAVAPKLTVSFTTGAKTVTNIATEYYKVEYLNAKGAKVTPVNAGTYRVRLVGTGKYDSNKVAFTGTKIAGTSKITQAKNELDAAKYKVKKSFKRKKLKKAKTFELPYLMADFGETTAKWKISKANKKSKKTLKLSGSKIKVKKKAKKGTYKLTLTANIAGTSNYAKAKLPKPVTVKVKVK